MERVCCECVSFSFTTTMLTAIQLLETRSKGVDWDALEEEVRRLAGKSELNHEDEWLCEVMCEVYVANAQKPPTGIRPKSRDLWLNALCGNIILPTNTTTDCIMGIRPSLLMVAMAVLHGVKLIAPSAAKLVKMWMTKSLYSLALTCEMSNGDVRSYAWDALEYAMSHSKQQYTLNEVKALAD